MTKYFNKDYYSTMAEIRAVSEIAEKWARVTPQRSEDYEQGVRNPKEDWASKTAGAADNWKQGVQQAAQDGRFTKGVQAAGTSKWQDRTIAKGVQRWGPGVQLGQGDYETGFAPFAAVIARTQLPPRFPKGDPRNIERVRVIATALRNAKVRGAS